jgi:uncharacterized protein (DUF302 family)
MANEHEHREARPSVARTRIIWGLSGLVAGAILCGVAMFALMPSMMLTVQQSRFGTVEETCAALEKAIEAGGWSSPATRDMKKAMAKHGVEFPGEVRIVELCKAEYAGKVLATNPEVLTLMPCAWGVYKGADGKVYVSGMNMGLMGKMFGGTIAEVMGGSVAKDEHGMLADIVVD